MKKIEEYLYNNGLDWTDIILYILMGVLIALAIVLIGVIVYGIWETVTAKHEYISGEIYCIKEHKSKTDSSLPMKTGDITGFIDIDDKEYISVFRYNGKKIKSDDEDIYKQVKTGKRYLAKIDIVTYKDGTTEYDVMEIISKVKEK